MTKPTFFPTPADWRAWLAENHDKESELLVGFYKKDSGKPSITWPESVDQALCFGWIDGIRKSIDEESYTIRFTPRKPRSNWSGVNIKRFGELAEQGLVHLAGQAAFDKRKDETSNVYSYEQRDKIKLAEDYVKQLEGNPKAHEFFQAQAASYQKAVRHWIMSAKRPETQLKRLQTLIEDSANGRRIPQFVSPTPGWKK
ncbi:MAG: YdeI/OmpD-associated family protein [Anaerolineae bacterium]|nr:YdeI/OmpD-associated family protein [Anaerolineae bacterium]